MAFEPFAKKDLSALHAEGGDGHSSLKRALGPFDVLALGIGAIIGAGIFVLTGSAAARYAGPAIMLSFVIAAIACAFAGLCYAEFASLIPIAGSAYTYGYASLGELVAWIIGWDLILEYAFGAATVAVGWSGYVNSFLQDHGVTMSPVLTAAPGTELVQYAGRWQRLATVEETVRGTSIDLASLPHATAVFDLVAFLSILVITGVLVVGIRESAAVNTAIVFVKVSIVLVFIGLAIAALTRSGWDTKNWHPFIPPNAGEFGKFGWSGILRGSAVIFFAYIGFDAVSTAAQETKNPKRDMPIGILGSLVVCTVLYILVSGLLTALVPYTALDVPDPVAVGVDATGVGWGRLLVKLGAIFGLASVMLVMLLAQSRVLFTMAHDGLLPPAAAQVHPRFLTPWVSTVAVGLFVSVFAGLVPIGILGELVSIGTLLAFVIVCASVWILRRKHPDLPRPFRTPGVPFVPIMGVVVAVAMMLALPWETWLRLAVWLAIGMAIYLGYGRKHSRVQKALGGTNPAAPRA